MWKISGAFLCTGTLSLSIAFAPVPPALADSYQNYSQFGLNLPQIAVPYGQDEVRAMDGTYCRSSVSNGGAYVDMGVVGNGGNEDVPGAGAVYGRVVLPLGRKPGRIDCTTLYDLEIQRLRLELQLTKMGLSNSTRPIQNGDLQSGWTTEGRTQAAKPSP